MSAHPARPSTSSLRAKLAAAGEPALGLGEAVEFFAQTLRGVWGGRVFTYFHEVLRQANLLVRGSVIIVLGLVFAIGLDVGIEAVYAAHQVGAPSFSGAFTSITDLREACYYTFSWMLAAKVSTGFVAEIGTMRISDEVDALDVMGLDSVAYLASTRLLAAWVVVPFIFMSAVAVAFTASFLAVVVQIGEVTHGGYLQLFWKFQNPTDYLFSFLKCMTSATFVVLVGCYFGYTVRASGGPAAVGHATAKAMLVNIVGVFLIGSVMSQIFWGGNPRLPFGG
jgi:phospholipid/cholesterol/gamma-HCH transport system permease protein